MALVVLGLFVLVWIISAVVKASQSGGPQARPGPANRPRPNAEPRVERTSDTDIDRFMAEIDRLRRKGEGAPAGRPAQPAQQSPRPMIDRPPSRPEPPRSRPAAERRERERDRERRPRPTVRPAPPVLPAESVPVLRPITPEATSPQAPPAPAAPPAARTARLAKMAGPTGPSKPSPVFVTLQSILKSKDGPAAALILTEIFGEPPGKRAMMGGKRS